MTPTAKRDAAAEAYYQKQLECGELNSRHMDDLHGAFCVGWDAAIAELSKGAGEFDEQACHDKNTVIKDGIRWTSDETPDFIRGARYQHARDFTRIQQLEGLVKSKIQMLLAQADEVERYRTALEFYAKQRHPIHSDYEFNVDVARAALNAEGTK